MATRGPQRPLPSTNRSPPASRDRTMAHASSIFLARNMAASSVAVFLGKRLMTLKPALNWTCGRPRHSGQPRRRGVHSATHAWPQSLHCSTSRPRCAEIDGWNFLCVTEPNVARADRGVK